MRPWILLFALVGLVISLGCGGAGGGVTPEGVWSGGYVSTLNVVNGDLDFEFVITDTTLTGFARLQTGGNTYTGSIVGTYTGDFNFTVNYNGGYGVVTYSLLISGNVLGGDYSRTGESGTVFMNFVASTTPVAAGIWNGTYIASVAPPANGTVTTTFTQSGNLLSGTMGITPQGGSLITANVSGEIFGTNVQLRGDFTGIGEIQWEGTVSGAPPASMSGQYTAPAGNGVFTMTKQ